MRNMILSVLLASMTAPAFGQLNESQAIDSFNQAVMKSARESNLNRRELLQLRFGLTFHGKVLRSQVASKLWTDGVIGDDFDSSGLYRIDAIDWDSLLPALKELLPMILDFIKQLLEIFGSSVSVESPDDPGVIIGSNSFGNSRTLADIPSVSTTTTTTVQPKKRIQQPIPQIKLIAPTGKQSSAIKQPVTIREQHQDYVVMPKPNEWTSPITKPNTNPI
jgi:hypothetical protein